MFEPLNLEMMEGCSKGELYPSPTFLLGHICVYQDWYWFYSQELCGELMVVCQHESQTCTATYLMMLSNTHCPLLLVCSHTTAYKKFQVYSWYLCSVIILLTHLHTIYFDSGFELVLKNLLPRRTCTWTCWFSPAVQDLNLSSGSNFGNPTYTKAYGLL